MKVYSCWNPPKVPLEHSDKPSITDQLAAEDLSTVVERFLQQPYVPHDDSYDYEGDESGALTKLNDSANVDVSKLDRVDCLEILADAERLASQLQKFTKQQTAQTSEKSTDSQKVVQDVENGPENAK